MTSEYIPFRVDFKGIIARIISESDGGRITLSAVRHNHIYFTDGMARTALEWGESNGYLSPMWDGLGNIWEVTEKGRSLIEGVA